VIETSVDTTEKNTAHADVFAMFGDVFQNGTNPGQGSENVEDVLKNMKPTKDQMKKPKIKDTKKENDILFDLFGGVDIEKTRPSNGKNGEEDDQKQKEKIRVQAAKEIKRIINSFPDLSFLKNIKVT